MAIVVSEGSLVQTHREIMRPTALRGGLELYSGRIADYAELYRVQPNLRLVIRFLARNIAQLGIGAYRRVSATERIELEPDHPLRQFLRNPTPSLPVPTSRHAWIRGIVEDLALYDALFVLKLRNPATPSKLNGIRIPPTKIQPIGDSWLWPEGFQIMGNAERPEYAAPDVIYLHGHNPNDPRVGIPPAEALRRILAEEAASGDWREQYWRNSARMSGVVERPADAPKWSDPARQRWEEEWRALRTGNGPETGATVVLEEGMKFNPATFSPKESEYLGARRLTREETAAQYFIPPVFVGILEHANFANIKEQHVGLYADTLGPWLDWLSEEFEGQLVPEFPDTTDVYLEFKIEEKLRGRFEEQAAAIQTATGAPWLSRNEARAMFNREPIDGGDGLVVPLNVLVGGQASPTDAGAQNRTGAASRSKARDGNLPRYALGWHARHVASVRSFFERQRQAVLSKLGAGMTVDEAFDANRWNDELRTDLLAVSVGMTEELGGEVASRFGAELDVDRTMAYLTENARIAAEGVNHSTRLELLDAFSVPRTATASRKAASTMDDALDEMGLDLADTDLEDPLDPERLLDPVRAVFDTAIAVRALQIATSRTTSVGQFARHEGASQAGARKKVWVSSGAPNSRHENLDGETVDLGEAFSNGAQWPGDPVLGVDETAGCLCSLDFSN